MSSTSRARNIWSIHNGGNYPIRPSVHPIRSWIVWQLQYRVSLLHQTQYSREPPRSAFPLFIIVVFVRANDIQLFHSVPPIDMGIGRIFHKIDKLTGNTTWIGMALGHYSFTHHASSNSFLDITRARVLTPLHTYTSQRQLLFKSLLQWSCCTVIRLPFGQYYSRNYIAPPGFGFTRT